jgi:hypothetical protein
MSSVAYSDGVKRHSDIPKEVYYKFIKKVRPHISDHEMNQILNAVIYYSPRYFGDDIEGIEWTLSIIAGESSFRNVLGDLDKGISHGYMQIQKRTCDETRKFNGIKRKLDLNKLYQNIHCGMGHLSQLHKRYDGNFIYAVIAYNNGYPSTDRWIRRGTISTKTEYLSWILSKKNKLNKLKNSPKYK